MKRLPIAPIALSLAAATLSVGLASGPAPQARPAQGGTPSSQVVRPARVTAAVPAAVPSDSNDTIRTFCVGCHNDKVRRGDLSLASFDVVEGRRARGHRREDDPQAAHRHDAAERSGAKARCGHAHGAGDRARDDARRRGCRTPTRAGASFQRLNRAEYAAAIRTLFGLDIDVSTYLPADTISASFDNIADVQMPSATVMQGYLRAAAHVSRVAVGDPFDRRQLDAVPRCRGRSRRRAASKARRSARAAARSSRTTSRPTATTSSRCCSTASRPGSSSAGPSATSRWKWRSTATASRC